jgi:uncharacterized protein (TIGR04255 family)
MSKLPNAPLIEVIFELRWQIKDKEDIQIYQYLIGDLYSSIKDKFSFREPLFPGGFPPEFSINNPAHRFRTEKNGYPLVQIGPGVLTLNTTDDSYYWEEFYKWSKDLLTNFLNIFPKHKQLFKSNLLYIDFFPFNFIDNDALEFVNKNFDISISQGFLKKPGNPYHIDVGYYYETKVGNLSVTLKKGKSTDHKDGILMQSSIQNQNELSELQAILDWLEGAHEFSSQLFKDITKGSLYKSFK